MRALTLWQPWASLVASGAKTIETRSWSTRYRGPLAIHAAKEPYRGAWSGDLLRALEDLCGIENYPRALPLGAVVAICELVDVVPIVDGHEVDAAAESLADCVVATYYPLRDPPNRTLTALRRDVLVDVLDQLPLGDFAPGRHAWILGAVRKLDSPLPAKGRQGLWKWETVG